jgi:bifunctional non-homologous end joining protein LigD
VSPLEEYKRKRDFRRTPEPAGGATSSGGFAYVIQKHAASRLHYDFRLELDGVLLSWAVPKGPSLDPAERRLAVHVEDHPIEYGTFEGTIPKGEYGGGTVLLWDRGRWIPEGDPHAGMRKGDLKFRLEGEKLGGSWVLVRIRGKPEDKAENWLLIKHRDEFARSLSDYDVLEDRPESVASGRTLPEIASAKDRVWSSKQKDGGPLASGIPDPGTLAGARKGALPGEPEAELATLVDKAPQGDGWLHEIKFDGYRILAVLKNGRATLMTRNAKDWTDRFKPVATAAEGIPVTDAVLDGEVVVLQENGTTSFQALQNALSPGRTAELTYFLFDILHLNGYDLRGVPLEERKRVLRAVLGLRGGGRLRFSDHVVGNGPEFLAQACGLQVEGIISKRRDSPYRGIRGRDWVKVKCVTRQEFVIAGFTDPGGSRTGFGALLLGVYDGADLRYAGRVGTGFNEKLLKDLTKRLKPLEVDRPAFVNPPVGAEARGVHWIRPELVAEVKFAEFTDHGQLRHPSYQGLREDKDPKSVVREKMRHVNENSSEAASSAKKSGRRASPKSGANETSAAEPTGRAGKKVAGRSGKSVADRAAERAATPATVEKLAGKRASGKKGAFTVAGVTLSNPDREYYPEDGITKREVAEYYQAIWQHIAPHISARPLTLVRCPSGYLGECFYQKHADEHMPAEHVRRVRIKETEEARDYLWIDSLAGLLHVFQLGTLELHTWQGRVDKLERPDRIVLDLDPGEDVPFIRTAEAAVLLKLRLDELGLTSFVKTTGGKGLHVVAPLSRRNTWDELVEFARALSLEMSKADPRRFLSKSTKAARTGKIYVDYLRNGRGATSVEAFSTRARAGATVSTPIFWEELAEGVTSDAFNVRNVPERLEELESDPWEEYFEVRQNITKEMMRDVGMKP